MENIISRHRNLTILAVVLFAQLLGLAYQVKRNTDRGSTRLVRVWAVTAITPLEKAFVHSVSATATAWNNYLYLRDVRRQNEVLREEIQRMRLRQVRIAEDAYQARRLQALLGFKEQFISQTVAAQVISTTGSEFSRGVYIDKGSRDGIKTDMPVITPEGIVGKVYRAYPTSSLVLEVSDASSGAGVILEKSRLQGILKGSPSGETFVGNIMEDEKIEPGERVLTSGGDRVYPKGLPVGTVTGVSSTGTFLNVKVKPSAPLDRLEEVLVITSVVERAPDTSEPENPVRAIDVLAERLPSVPPPKPTDTPGGAAAAPGTRSNPTPNPAKPAGATTTAPAGPQKPSGKAAQPKPAATGPTANATAANEGTGKNPTATQTSVGTPAPGGKAAKPDSTKETPH